jgi:DNA polymerase-3 subunit epsilon
VARFFTVTIKMFEVDMENNKITVIDFETSTRAYSSICEIGITLIADGVIKDTKKFYIQPPDNKYLIENINVNGIKPEITANSPTFPVIWEKVKSYFVGTYIAAHNANFDMTALKTTLDFYGLEQPHFMFFDTSNLFNRWLDHDDKRTLDALCNKFGISLVNHHDAGDDSYATAQLIIYLYKNGEFKSYVDFLNSLTLINYGTISIKKPINFKSFPSHKTAKEIAATTTLNSEKDADFDGKTVLFTGELTTISRDDARREVVKRGGFVKDGMSRQIDILVNANQPGVITDKVKRALDLQSKGCPIIIVSEKTFLKMLVDNGAVDLNEE